MKRSSNPHEKCRCNKKQVRAVEKPEKYPQQPCSVQTINVVSENSSSVSLHSIHGYSLRLLEQVTRLINEIKNTKHVPRFAMCTHCQYFNNVSNSCRRCRKMIQSFVATEYPYYKRNDYEELIQWLSKINRVLKKILDSKIVCPHITKGSTAYDNELDKLLNELRAPFELPKHSIEITDLSALKLTDDIQSNVAATANLDRTSKQDRQNQIKSPETSATKQTVKDAVTGKVDRIAENDDWTFSEKDGKKDKAHEKVAKDDEKLGNDVGKLGTDASRKGKDDRKMGKNEGIVRRAEGKKAKDDAEGGKVKRAEEKEAKDDEKGGNVRRAEGKEAKDDEKGEKVRRAEGKEAKHDKKAGRGEGKVGKNDGKIGKDSTKFPSLASSTLLSSKEKGKKGDKKGKDEGKLGPVDEDEEKDVGKIGKDELKFPSLPSSTLLSLIEKVKTGDKKSKVEEKLGKNEGKVGKGIKKNGARLDGKIHVDDIEENDSKLRKQNTGVKNKSDGKFVKGKRKTHKIEADEANDTKDEVVVRKFELKNIPISSETNLLLKYFKTEREKPKMIMKKQKPKSDDDDDSQDSIIPKWLLENVGEILRVPDDISSISTASNEVKKDAAGCVVDGNKWKIEGNQIVRLKREQKPLKPKPKRVLKTLRPHKKMPLRRIVRQRHKIMEGSYLIYKLSDRGFIENGYTQLPVVATCRAMYIYKTRKQNNWFDLHKGVGSLYYDTGETLAVVDENGYGKWYYRNGVTALNYYKSKDSETGYRCIVYSSGTKDKFGRKRLVTILACFDHLGNGIVYDHLGKVRLKYNQTEGVVYDKNIAPRCRWQWHSLGRFSINKLVCVEQHEYTPEIDTKEDNKVLSPDDTKEQNETTQDSRPNVEFNNFLRSAKEIKNKFEPYQIRLKIFKINEEFSLHIIDQGNIYLLFRDGLISMKLELGIALNVSEILLSDVSDFSETKTPYDSYSPDDTDSIVHINKVINRTREHMHNIKVNLRPCY